jgi:hypothetical protein
MRLDALIGLVNTIDLVCLQPYNLADIVQKSAYLKLVACGFVHCALVLRKNIVMHLANDEYTNYCVYI